jgi:subtilase family serine protease
MTPATSPAAGFNPCPPCYGPPDIRAAYNVPSNLTGSGRTIVIISAFQSPVVQSDTASFSAHFGLPASNVQVVVPDGAPLFDPTNSVQLAWVGEQSADVEWAHAIAPGANLVVVEAKSQADADLLSATKYAVDHNLGDVFSMSFGEAERCPSSSFLADEHATFARAVRKGITLVASSGDTGAAQPTCDGSLVAGVSTPASDPLVTAVGGTRLTLTSTGAYGSEVAWNDMAGASGGGFSAIYRRPSYQAEFVKEHKGRGVPDVAWSSAFVGGATMIVFHGKPLAIFGTSLAAPAWSGVAALADQAAGRRLGQLNRVLYRANRDEDGGGRFHDIATGNNSFHGFTGFSAAGGWDPVTGLGTPNVAKLLGSLRESSTDDATED